MGDASQRATHTKSASGQRRFHPLARHLAEQLSAPATRKPTGTIAGTLRVNEAEHCKDHKRNDKST